MRARTVAVALVLVSISAALVGAQAQPQQAAPAPIQSGFGQGAYNTGNGVSAPQLIKEVKPVYTPAGAQAGIQGSVELEAIVLANGTIGDVRVTKSLDTTYGLDQQAIAAAKQWLFKPGYVNGVAVPVLVTLILEFRPAPVRPGGRVSDPKLLKEVRPVYPPNVERTRKLVELEAVVDANGRVTEVRILKTGENPFDAAAVAAARQWMFEPGRRDGKPVPVLVTLILEFNPNDAPALYDFLKGVTRQSDPGAVPPKLLRSVRPNYTQAAMREKIQGVVEIEAVVMPDGTVARARVTKSLDPTFGLDAEAVLAARQYQFEPNSGTLNGVPVPFLVMIELDFRLH